MPVLEVSTSLNEIDHFIDYEEMKLGFFQTSIDDLFIGFEDEENERMDYKKKKKNKNKQTTYKLTPSLPLSDISDSIIA